MGMRRVGVTALGRAGPRLACVLAGVLSYALASLPVTAQIVSPQVLRQMQGSLGSSGSGADPLDPSRGPAAEAAPPGSRIDTREEQAVRRAEARRRLDRLYRASPVEREYRQRLNEPTLRQFGYDLFEAANPASAAVTGAVSDDYVLGVGDELVVQLQGATNDSLTVRVNREGSLVVSSLPPVRAAGRSLGAVRRDVEAATKRVLLGTDAYVSLGSVRSATVFVGGEVERPGQYALTALSDLSVALAQAGGVRRSGSLRTVRVVRGGQTLTVDLYGLLGIGMPPALRLQDGDRVIVPVLGRTVAIAGSVTRPGIYELKDGASVGALIDYAGGAVRPRGNQISISRIGADGAEQFIKAAGLDTALMAGDAVQLLGGSAGGAAGRVVLRGHVDNPGARALAAAPTVADLLGGMAALKPDTYLPFALIVRRDAETAARRFVPVNLGSALRGEPVALASEDMLYVFSREDVEFLNSTGLRRVVLGQQNMARQCVALDRLEQLVQGGQTARFSVVTRLAFLVERNGQTDVGATGGRVNFARRGAEATTGRAARRGTADEASEAGEEALPMTAGRQSMASPRPARAGRAAGEAVLENDPRGELAGVEEQLFEPLELCPLVFEEAPELLPVLIENAVAVGGAVRRPGAYPVAGSVGVDTLAAVAEGILDTATDLSLDIARGAGGEVVQEKVDAASRTGVMAATMVRAGDDVRFNAAQPQFEAGAVLLSGEFNRPGLYSIRKGETLAELVARAGGLSPYAYPYGAIFTRRSVQQLQQEGLRRTTRELTQGLVSVAARSREGQGGALMAGQALIEELNSLEALGRVVVEADPRVLAQRPDLDTVLESGDAIVMPKRPNFVLALGDVANPGALQFVAGKSAQAYLREAGGTASTADGKRAFIVLPDGSSQPLRGRGWGRGYAGVVPPGSTIIVPKNIDPLYKLGVARDITGIVTGLLSSVATVAILATR